MRRWKIYEQDEDKVAALCSALKCSHFFARILINRGFDTPAAAKAFLQVDSIDLPDPFLFESMDRVVNRIGDAIKAGQKITVYGDYDVDGITATGLLVEVLRELGGTVDYYIPSRFTEGYGVNVDAVHAIAQNGTKLLIIIKKNLIIL